MKQYFIGGVFSLIILFWMFGTSSTVHIEEYKKDDSVSNASGSPVITTTAGTETTSIASTSAHQPKETVTHITTPKELKAVYMSSWVASTPSARDRLVKMLDETELNAVVIDVKDNTGVITWDGRMKEEDLVVFIEELHNKNIYVIGRVAVFQDPKYAMAHKDHAVQRKDGGIWKSRKGEAWVDTGSKQMWKNTVLIGIEAYQLGFDEINLDYIRFSTEGVKDGLVFPQSGSRAKNDRVGVVSEFP